jgi:hypothetical protein
MVQKNDAPPAPPSLYRAHHPCRTRAQHYNIDLLHLNSHRLL